MVTAAIGSALAPSLWVLIGFRFLLGFGTGGDYPVSVVLMSEYANRKDRGKLAGMVFGTRAPGQIVGPLAALALLGAGAGTTWRDGPCWPRCGARRRGDVPTPQDARIAVVSVQVQGRAGQAARQLTRFTGGQVSGQAADGRGAVMGLRAFRTSRRWLILPTGTAGTGFLLDYAYCSNTISTPQILTLISPHASSAAKMALQRDLPGGHAHHRAWRLGRRRQARRVHRVVLFPLLQSGLGLRGTLLLTAGVSAPGLALTLVLPEPAGRSLEEIAPGLPGARPVPLLTADQASA